MSDQYPEHEKLSKVHDLSQAQGEFLAWLLEEKDFVLAQYDDGSDRLWPARQRIENLLAEYWDIDLNVLSSEKEAMLESIREGYG